MKTTNNPGAAPVYIAANRARNVFCVCSCSCFEELQGWFRFGILIEPGIFADWIGAARSRAHLDRAFAGKGLREVQP